LEEEFENFDDDFEDDEVLKIYKSKSFPYTSNEEIRLLPEWN
jgi:hypothetical protein